MDLLTRFLNSKALHVAQARQIPGLAVNFIDIQNTYQNEWQNFLKVGSPTTFTNKALNYYFTELNNLVPPADFVQTEPDIPLNQWNSKQTYYTPGAAGTLGQG
jgi:hypothetical protein